MEVCRITLRAVFLVIGLCPLFSATTCGLDQEAEQEIRTVLSRFMAETKTGMIHFRPVNQAAREYGVALVPYLEQYLADPCEGIRWQAQAYMVRVALDSNDLAARQAVVHTLLTRLRDDPAGGNRQWLGSRLSQFTSADSSSEAKQILRERLSIVLASLANPEVRMNVYEQQYAVLLIGVADMKGELPRLQEYIDHHKKGFQELLKTRHWRGSVTWHAMKARARMGVQQDIQQCIAMVESHPDEDYRAAWLFKELAYVRQPEVAEYLHKYLKSEKVPEIRSRDVIVSSYAQRAAMALAEMLRGFPGRRDSGGDRKTIQRCREWMGENKEWEIIR